MKRRIFALILLPVSLILTLMAKYGTGFAEFYALNIYPVFVGAISFFTSKARFSFTEFIIAALIVVLTVYLISVIIRFASEKTLKHIKGFILTIAVA
ncbi:MAG TPA: hypothetical protein DC038_09485, partial [Clostridiales bacterium]|nr:hypothetical protein [Clostridiales bacterium]